MMGLSYYFDAFAINYLWCYLALFLGIASGMFMYSKFGNTWGVKKSIVIMCLIFGGGMTLLMLLGQYLFVGIIGFFCAGIGFTGGMYMIPLMNGDVIDYDEHVCGLRREGMYAGVNSFICKPSISIANALFPAMLLWFGFNQDVSMIEQTDLAKLGIKLSWLLIPAVLLLICAISIQLFYPLHGPKWAAIKEDLTKIHNEKQTRHEQEVLCNKK